MSNIIYISAQRGGKISSKIRYRYYKFYALFSLIKKRNLMGPKMTLIFFTTGKFDSIL